MGVVPLLSGAFGLSVEGINNRTISICPLSAAQLMGVIPALLAAFGLSVEGINNRTISTWPFLAA